MDKAYYIQKIDVSGNEIFIYSVQFPGTDIHEAVMPCQDGYTIYLDSRLSMEGKKKAYSHAIGHILLQTELTGASQDEFSRCEFRMIHMHF